MVIEKLEDIAIFILNTIIEKDKPKKEIKMDLKQIKEHFKGAKTIKCLFDNNIYNIDVDGEFTLQTDVTGTVSYRFDFDVEQNGESCCILSEDYGNMVKLAEIISYKKEKESKMDIKKVQDYFKDAKEVRCVVSNDIFNIEVDGRYEHVIRAIAFRSKSSQNNNSNCVLYDNSKPINKLAEIISYKIKKESKMDIKKVQDYFKDAKEVRCLLDDKVYNIDVQGYIYEVELGDNYNYYLNEFENGSCVVALARSGEYAEIISKKEPEKREYPKVMLVSHNEKSWETRVVFREKNDMFIAWHGVETLEDAKKECRTLAWNFAKELPTEIEVTKEEIAKWKGCDVDQLIIK